MITLNNILGLRGLSTDIKPTDGIRTNCRFWELDTGKYYYFDGSAWQDAPGGGGGGGGGGVVYVDVEGSTPVISAEDNHVYICGEVSTLSFTPSATGICEVLFTSGSLATILTLPATVKMPEWFEVEINHTYEISILNGVYGGVMSWPTA